MNPRYGNDKTVVFQEEFLSNGGTEWSPVNDSSGNTSWTCMLSGGSCTVALPVEGLSLACGGAGEHGVQVSGVARVNATTAFNYTAIYTETHNGLYYGLWC